MGYKVETTEIPGVLVLTPRIFEDERGFFYESFNQREFDKAIGCNDFSFVQDNHSKSRQNTLRGLHFQEPAPQGKLVRATSGAVFDVVVDLRRNSSTFGQWLGLELSQDNKRQIWIPPGLAHGFLVTSTEAEVLYKTTDYYKPENEKILLWNDENINILWPNISEPPIISEKDRNGLALSDFIDIDF